MHRTLPLLAGLALGFLAALALIAAAVLALAGLRLRGLLGAHPGLGAMAEVTPRQLFAAAGASGLGALALLAVGLAALARGGRRPPATPD
jgi:hypothetical protein